MFQLKNYMKLLNTCSIYCSFLCLGLLLSVVGPSLLDLQHLIHADTQQISHVYTARSTGHVVGAILSGVVLDMVRYRDRQAVLSVCCFVVGGTMIGIPWSRNFATLVSCMMVNGMFLGALETGGNICILSLWGKDSGPIFQGLHFTLGLGGFIAPLIAAPYLEYRLTNSATGYPSTTEKIPLDFDTKSANPAAYEQPTTALLSPTIHNLEIIMNSSLRHFSHSTWLEGELQANQRIPGITYPFSITGSVACVTAVMLMVTGAMSTSEQAQKDEAKRDNDKRSRGFMGTAVLLVFLLIFVSCAMEIGYAQMLTSYCVKGSLHLTVRQGSYLTSAFWAVFAASRLTSAFLAIRVSNLALMVGDLVLVSVSSLMLLLLMPSKGVLWAATVLFGTGIGSFYASTVGWVNSRVQVTSKIASIITVGAAAGEMVGPVTISYFLDTLPDMVAYFTSSACLLSWLIMLILYLFLRRFDKHVYATKADVYTVRTASLNI